MGCGASCLRPAHREGPPEDSVLESCPGSGEARGVHRREAAQVELRKWIGDDAQALTMRVARDDAGDRGHVLGEPPHVGAAH